LNRAARDRVNHHCADKPATPRRIDPVAGAGFAQRGTLHALCAIDALGIGCPFQTDIAITCGRVVSSAEPDDKVVWYDLAYAEAAATSCCPSIGFFCADGHLQQWMAAKNPPRAGTRLTLAEAMEGPGDLRARTCHTVNAAAASLRGQYWKPIAYRS
jgi:hypothetical protein